MDVRPEVVVQIDSLVIEGFARGEAALAGAALQSELQRLIAEQGLPAGLSGDAQVISVDEPLELRAGMRPEQLGALAARALYARWQA